MTRTPAYDGEVVGDGSDGHGHGPHHRHGHGDPLDWAARGAELVTEGELTAPMVDQALSWVASRVPGARDVLDVGSGPGVAACTFALLLPPARVICVDSAAPLLDLARERAGRLGVADRLTTRLVSLPAGLTDLPQADIVWVSGVIHHLPDPVAALRAAGALVRPGGLLAVREGGLPIRFLPDSAAPGLLPRLEAASEDLIPAGRHPAGIVAHHGSWPDLLRAAGLRPAGSKSFLLDLPAPLSQEARDWLLARLVKLREFAGEQVSDADAATVSRLLDPEGPDGLLRRSDVYLLTASTIHTAQPS